MAYSAYCDTASATKWWITGTGSSVNRLSEVMDDNASGVEEADNPGNYQPWSTFMTEVVEDKVYLIHLDLDIGDGSTATTLTSEREHVVFDSGYGPRVVSKGVLTLGALTGDWGTKGSFWEISGVSTTNERITEYGATLNIYASTLYDSHLGYCDIYGTTDFRNSILMHSYDVDSSYRRRFSWGGSQVKSLRNVFICNSYGANFNIVPGTFENVHIHSGGYGVYCTKHSTPFTTKEAKFTNNSIADVATYSAAGNVVTFNLVDPKSAVGTVALSGDGAAVSSINEQYTCNITVVDKDGTGIVGATVACTGSDSGTASEEYDTVGFTTADTGASGVLAEQTVTVKKWVGTSETLTNYNYFKFTITEPGYETLVMEKVTIDAPIVWHLELQPSKQPPAPWQDGLM